jgi:dTDP-4-amino-4,6-dideoxygalactose transaminase
MNRMIVPFYRPSLTQKEIDEVVECLKSGWLTTGPRTKQFEQEFAQHLRVDPARSRLRDDRENVFSENHW